MSKSPIFGFLAALVVATAMGVAPASSAKIYPYASGFIAFEGEITPGDFDRLLDVYEHLPHDARSKIIVDFDSPGGDLREAMTIGAWLRDNGIWTGVRSRSSCASACVFAFAGGVFRAADGQLLVHRPHLTQLPQQGVDAAMKSLLSASKKYLAEMNVPEQLAELMFSIPPDRVRVLNSAEIDQYRLDGEDMSASEERSLRWAQRLGISRIELMQRLSAYQQSPELGACLDLAEDEQIACARSVAAAYGLGNE